MKELLKNSTSWLNQESDPRADHLFLMSSPVPTILICLSFLILSKLLHVWMKRRAAVTIRWAIWSFDFFHFAVSASFLFMIFNFKLLQNFNFRCQPVDKSPNGDNIVLLVWWYFLYNFTFFSEIFIFLLGKKHDRITKYFLFHHIALPISIWWIVKFSPTGHSLFFGFINCTTHVISFGYLSLIGAFPAVKKYFRYWRIFFHSLLIFRIFIIVLHAVQLFFSNDCSYPMIYPYVVVINAPFFLALTIVDHLMGKKQNNLRAQSFEEIRHNHNNL